MNTETNRDNISNHFNNTRTLIEKISNMLNQPLFASDFMGNINKVSTQLAGIFNIFSAAIQNVPDRSKPIIKKLAAVGWYMSLELPLDKLWVLEDHFTKNEIHKIDEYMISFFEDQKSYIGNYLTTKFPNRSDILRKAFQAHRNEDYELSVPVFLTQADGICHDILEVKLYSTKKGMPLTSKKITDIIDCSFTDAALEPLRNITSLNAPESAMNSFPCSFNRHEIIHGISTDYNTKTNSLKSISLLNYLSTIVYEAAMKNKETRENT